MKRISIKLVVACLLVVASLSAMFIALIPPALSLKSDAVDFVVEAAESAAAQAQFILAGRLRMVRLFCNVIYHAALADDLLSQLEPWKLIRWGGAVVVSQDLSLILAAKDNRGFLITAYNTVVLGAPLPGYVYVTNFTVPGQYVSSGFFNLNTLVPANTSVPWMNVASTVRFRASSAGVKLASPNRTSPFEWVSPSTRIARGAASSLLSYGGTVDRSGKDQLLSCSFRGDALSSYIANVHITTNGIAVIADAATTAYIAGTISDPTGRVVNNTAILLSLRELRDPRFAPILRSSFKGDNASCGFEALLRCATPCVTFTFWPHSHTLVASGRGDGKHSEMLDVLFHTFVVVRVVDVSDSVDTGALALRLIVTIPSNDVIQAFLNGFYQSLGIPATLVIVVCAATIVLVAFTFRHLSELERDLLRLVNVFTEQHNQQQHDDEVIPLGANHNHHRLVVIRGEATAFLSMFPEFQRISRAMGTLARQLYTLRAFSSLQVHQPPLTSAPLSPLLSSDHYTPTTDTSKRHEDFLSSLVRERSDYFGDRTFDECSDGGIPYDIGGGKSWRVPVTTVWATCGEGMLSAGKLLSAADPVAVFQRHDVVLRVIQKHTAKYKRAAAVDYFFGDWFLMHFNAAGRVPNHVAAAVGAVCGCLQELRVALHLQIRHSQQRLPTTPVHFGIATNLALCGFMGPKQSKSFTVVSPGEAQAAVVCRVATTLNVPVMLTWRAAEVAQQTHSGKGRLPSANVTPLLRYVPIARILLPSETQVTTAFTLTNSKMDKGTKGYDLP